MKRTCSLTVMMTALLAAPAALAWDGYDMWYAPADGAMPGGGGLIGTGSLSSSGVNCAHCHIDGPGMITADLTFVPALPTVGGQPGYAPGQSYQVTVAMQGETKGLANCDGTRNVNNFAATFEDANGAVVGTLATDSGLSSSSCVPSLSAKPSGTTMVYGDCSSVISTDSDNSTSWTFNWTAPPAGSGPLTVHYGVTDGDCQMDSQGDDTVVKQLLLSEATAMRLTPRHDAPNGDDDRLALAAAMLPLVWLAFGFRRRRR